MGTISKLIRESVDFYIEFKMKNPGIKKFSEIAFNLKEPLTAIKGYTHILIERYKNDLTLDIIFTLRDILEKSTNLENKIKEMLEIDIRAPLESR